MKGAEKMSFLTSESFVFHGKSSEDYHVIISWINSDANASINGLNREIIKSTTGKRRLKDNIYGIEHTDRITFSFCIVKADGSEFTRPESIAINEWLTSSSLPQLLKFNDNDNYMLHYYAVCTMINDVIAGGRFIGKELKFETNSPYSFTNKTEKTIEVTGEKSFILYNPADTHDGIYYPTITISAPTEQEITIENMTDKKSVTFNMINVPIDSAGNRIISFNGSEMTILDANDRLIPASALGWNEEYKSYVSTTGEAMTNIYWVRLLRGMNEFKVTGTCKLTIECEYPRKAGCL